MNNGNMNDFEPAEKKFNPLQLATTIRLYVRAVIQIVLWLVAAAVILAFGFVSARLLLWAVQQVLNAAGI